MKSTRSWYPRNKSERWGGGGKKRKVGGKKVARAEDSAAQRCFNSAVTMGAAKFVRKPPAPKKSGSGGGEGRGKRAPTPLIEETPGVKLIPIWWRGVTSTSVCVA